MPPQPELGVCYYPEHWPPDRWASDAASMVAMGLRKVRIGEFAWSRLEPRPGKFDWGWLDEAIDTLHSAGLQVILGTPTATPPRWLVQRMPDMLAIDAQGRPRQWGSRRHYCFSHQGYLKEACRITKEMALRYGTHPAVVAWQVDNEYGCHDTILSYSASARRRFQRWLATRYGAVEALNSAWGSVFWSQELTSFEQAELPVGAVTETQPAARLDFQRFASDEVQRFNRAQCEVLRRHSPGRVLMHNAMLFFDQYDHHQVLADLDVVGWDSYPLGALENFWFDERTKRRWLHTGHPDFAGFHHDLYRGISRQPFWVIEQQPGPVNWGAWNPAPADGMVRLWTWEAIAHGADLVSYFRWRQAPFGQEQMHAGLHLPDGTPDAGAREAAQVARELAAMALPPSRPAQVALVFDYPSLWAMQIQPQGADEHPLRIAFEAYSTLRSLGFDVDIVGSEADFSAYRLVVLPSQVIATEALADRLATSAARLVLYPRSGAKTEHFSIPGDLPPGPLRRLIDLRVTRVESLRPGVNAGGAQHWREWVEAGPGVWVEERFADGHPAVLQQGRTRYLTGRFDATALLWRAARESGLEPVALPEGLRLRRRGGLLFCINYGDAPQHIDLPGARWRLGGPVVPARGLAVCERG